MYTYMSWFWKNNKQFILDVDECNDGLVDCPGGNSTICVNTIGGYECHCRSGFTGGPNTSHGCTGTLISKYFSELNMS